MVEKPRKLQPALIGGLIIGLLSVIPVLDTCCCLWALVGGAVASYMLVRRSPHFPVSSGDGAAVGALSGLVGSAIALVINVPLNMLLMDSRIAAAQQMAESTNPAMREMILQAVEIMRNHPLLFSLLGWLANSIIYLAFATLGAIIGVAIFEKRKGQLPPPPPPAPGYPNTFAPPGPPPGGPSPGGPVPPPGETPHGGGEPPPYS